MTIDLDRYAETVEALAVLEGVAIGWAAPRIIAKDIREARSLNEQMRSCIEAMEPVEFNATDQRFHRILFRRCPNRRILSIVEREWDLIETTRRSVFEFTLEHAVSSVGEHEQLLQLIESGGSPEGIETFARRHGMRTARSPKGRDEQT